MSESLKERITEDMKTAMRAREKIRLGTIRLILAAIKQREVDERITLSDEQVLLVLGKMVKQRRDSLAQFEQAGREDLAAIESAELTLLSEYLPAALDADELQVIIEEVITATDASTPQDMGKVMGQLKARIQGRADMGVVSGMIKTRLSGT